MPVPVIELYQRAGVPRSCWGSKIDKGGPVDSWAKGLKDRADTKGALLSAYVLLPSERDGKQTDKLNAGLDTVELLTRSAVLEGGPVRLVVFHRLIHNLEHGVTEYRDDDLDVRRRPSVLDMLGQGVIAVPYVPTFEEATVSEFQYRMALDFLMTHIYEGGALIIGGTQAISRKLQSRYPKTFERMLVQNSEIFGA